eukprot:COSAG05_NODE_239_length_13139_cov_14.870475_2_plen_51_part_00
MISNIENTNFVNATLLLKESIYSPCSWSIRGSIPLETRSCTGSAAHRSAL